MNSNFKFLENEFPVLLDRSKKAEQLVITILERLCFMHVWP